MATEKALWRWLQKGTLALSREIHLQRVENSIKRGVPDVEGCYKGVSFWLELKAGEEPFRETSKVQCEPLKREQHDFIRKRIAAGGRVFILYRVGRKTYLIDGVYAHRLAPRPTLQALEYHSLCKTTTDPVSIIKRITE